MAGKRKTPTRDDSAYGSTGGEGARPGFGSARSHGEAGRRALQQWSDAQGSPNHRPPKPNALRKQHTPKGR